MGQVTISVNGRSYRFACGDGEEARISELAAHLNAKLRGLGQEFGRIGDDRLLVMAALMLADEAFEARAETAVVAAAQRQSTKTMADVTMADAQSERARTDIAPSENFRHAEMRVSVPAGPPRVRKPSAKP
jgi:cell division protein ZapA